MRFELHPSGMREDYTFDFDPTTFKDEDHAIWQELCERQKGTLQNRACKEYLETLNAFGYYENYGIPDYRRLSDMLEKRTGWRLVTVPGLVPDEVFFGHLAKKQFPITWWIRTREQLDYLVEPDIFHDLFGHVPMLANPVFADYMLSFGQGGLKAIQQGATKFIGRLYWFTVEFGLIQQEDGLRIYGSGIVSSKSESIYCLESKTPNRLKFDLMRSMRTDYDYKHIQKTYFVIDNFEQLFDATRPDFTPYYTELKNTPEIPEGKLVDTDQVITKGTLQG